jgi:hypothetical protein
MTAAILDTRPTVAWCAALAEPFVPIVRLRLAARCRRPGKGTRLT